MTTREDNGIVTNDKDRDDNNQVMRTRDDNGIVTNDKDRDDNNQVMRTRDDNGIVTNDKDRDDNNQATEPETAFYNFEKTKNGSHNDGMNDTTDQPKIATGEPVPSVMGKLDEKVELGSNSRPLTLMQRAETLILIEEWTKEEKLLLKKQLWVVFVAYLVFTWRRVTSPIPLFVEKPHLLVALQKIQTWIEETCPASLAALFCYPRLADDGNSVFIANTLLAFSLYYLWDKFWDVFIPHNEAHLLGDQPDCAAFAFYSMYNTYHGFPQLLTCCYAIYTSDNGSVERNLDGALYWLVPNMLGKVLYDFLRSPLKGYMLFHHTGEIAGLIGALGWASIAGTDIMDCHLLCGSGGETFPGAALRYFLLMLGKYGFIAKQYRVYTALAMMLPCVFETFISFLVWFHFCRRAVVPTSSLTDDLGSSILFSTPFDEWVLLLTPFQLVGFGMATWCVFNRIKMSSCWILKYIKSRAQHVKIMTDLEKEQPTLHVIDELTQQGGSQILVRDADDHTTESILRDRVTFELSRQNTFGPHEPYHDVFADNHASEFEAITSLYGSFALSTFSLTKLLSN